MIGGRSSGFVLAGGRSTGGLTGELHVFDVTHNHKGEDGSVDIRIWASHAGSSVSASVTLHSSPICPRVF